MTTTPDGPPDEPVRVCYEVTDRASLLRLSELVQQSDVDAQTTKITHPTLSADTTVELDLSILTKKQLATLELALDMGYYERPREVDLSALADELDVTRSAVSQRLRTAELKLIKLALDEFRDPSSGEE